MTTGSTSSAVKAPSRAAAPRGFDFGVSSKQLMLFTRQLATTLTAGLPIMRIIHVLHRRNSSPTMFRILGQIGQDLQKGTSFSEALARHPKVFDRMYLNMVQIGEASGNLPKVATRLAKLLEKEAALRRKIKGAMAYPMFVLLFSAVMSWALLAFLMPMFTPMFEDSGIDIQAEYPLTHLLIVASKFATDPKTILYLLGGVILIVGTYKAVVAQPAGRLMVDWVKYRLPGFATMIQQGTAARFCRALATLMQSGVPVLKALALVADSAGNMMISRSIKTVASSIQSGDKISETLEQVGVFPDLVVQMAAIGEEAGELPEMLERVADYYDEELDSTVAGMTALLEPGMMMLVGLMVGVFVMGLLLPIMGISAAYQNQL